MNADQIAISKIKKCLRINPDMDQFLKEISSQGVNKLLSSFMVIEGSFDLRYLFFENLKYTLASKGLYCFLIPETQVVTDVSSFLDNCPSNSVVIFEDTAQSYSRFDLDQTKFFEESLKIISIKNIFLILGAAQSRSNYTNNSNLPSLSQHTIARAGAYCLLKPATCDLGFIKTLVIFLKNRFGSYSKDLTVTLYE